MANDVGLKAVLSLDNSSFLGGLRGAGGAMGGAIGKLVALAGAGLSVAGVMAGVKSALDFGGRLNDLSAQTGISVGELTVLRQVFEDTGVGAESAGHSINIMQRSIAGLQGQAGVDMIAQLGLNVDELRDKNPTEQFQAIAAGIRGIGDPAQRTAAAMAIFGRGGGELNALFADPAAFEKARNSLGGLPAMMEQDAALFDDIGDSMGRLKMKSMGIFAGITEGVAPALKGVMDQIDGFDAAALGKRIGDSLAVGLEIFRSGKATEVIQLGLGIGFGKAINGLAGTLGSMDFWKGIGLVALGGLGALGAGLIKIFTMPIMYAQAGMDLLMDKIFEGLGKIPVVGKQLGLEGFTAGSFADHLQGRQDEGTFLTRAADQTLALAGGIVAEGRALMQSGMQSKIVIDTSEMETRMGSIMVEAGAQADARSAETLAAVAPAITTGMAGAIELVKAPKDKKAEKEDSDRWAKLGLNISGGGPGMDLTRRVATATERSARILERVARNLETFNPGGVPAVWA